MTLSSMTGFARTAFEAGGARFSWELKSVNARGLEIRLRLPPGLDHLEPDIRNRIRENLTRGSCFFALQRETNTDTARLALNEEALAIVIATARRLASVEGIGMPSADGLLAIPGVLQARSDKEDGEAAETRDAAIMEALGPAIAALKAARTEEGQRLNTVLQDQLATVERLTEAAGAISADAPELLKARIREQVAMLTAAGNGIDPDRLHQEALLAATRADVREELDRLHSHLTGAHQLINSGDAIGRRLEFLMQEFNREANTLCSKAFDRRLSGVGLELKAVIDQMREQAQNLE